MDRWLIVLLCVAATTFLSPPGLGAQDEGEGCGRTEYLPCGNQQFFCEYGGHKILGPGSEYSSAPCLIHSECYVCMVNGEEADIDECHGECEPSDEDQEYRTAYSYLTSALTEEDVIQVISIAARVPRHVHLNSARQSLQVLTCDRKWVRSNIPLSGAEMARAMALLDGAPATLARESRERVPGIES